MTLKHWILYDREGSNRHYVWKAHYWGGRLLWKVATLLDPIRQRELLKADAAWWAERGEPVQALSYTELMQRELKLSWKWHVASRYFQWWHRRCLAWQPLYRCTCPICLENYY